jgi:hypothetical protein
MPEIFSAREVESACQICSRALQAKLSSVKVKVDSTLPPVLTDGFGNQGSRSDPHLTTCIDDGAETAIKRAAAAKVNSPKIGAPESASSASYLEAGWAW